ncbi:MAG TPA: hypothetical protein VK914_04175 [bacterium]|nr:hypothetical protein [bacterium]
MSRAKMIARALPLALAANVLFFGIRIYVELTSGQQVFWLAELWPPAAVTTIIVVVGIDLLVSGVPPAAPAKARRRRAS